MHIDPRTLDDVHGAIHHGRTLEHAPVHGGIDPVIRLDDGNPLAMGHLQATVARGAIALVGLVHHHNARIARLKFTKNAEGAVLGSIIQTDDLQLTMCLGADAIQALGQVLLHVAHGNDDGNERGSVGFHAGRPFRNAAAKLIEHLAAFLSEQEYQGSPAYSPLCYHLTRIIKPRRQEAGTSRP